MLALVVLDDLIPKQHPIRKILELADACLARLQPTFEAKYAHHERPSIAPETLLKSMLLMALYMLRSERMLCARIQYDMLFRWFLGLSMHDEVFDASTFLKKPRKTITTQSGARVSA
jgi:transposase